MGGVWWCAVALLTSLVNGQLEKTTSAYVWTAPQLKAGQCPSDVAPDAAVQDEAAVRMAGQWVNSRK